MTSLILRRILLENFVSHSSSSLVLGPGVIAIVGNNGAGKSSIVDAVYVALTGDLEIRGSKEHLIRRGAKNAKIIVELEGDRDFLKIARTIGSKHSVAVVSSDKTEEARKRQAASDNQEKAKKIIVETLGLSQNSYNNLKEIISRAVIIRQGGLDEIFSKVLADKKGIKALEFLQKIFGVDEYAKASENLANDDLVSVNVGEKEYSATITDVRKLRIEIKQKESEIKYISREIEEKEGEAKKLTKEIEDKEKIRGEIEAKMKELQEKVNKLSELKTQLNTFQQELNSYENELRNLKRLYSNYKGVGCEEIKKELDNKEKIEKILELIDKINDVQKSIANLKNEKERLEDALRKLQLYLTLEDKMKGEDIDSLKSKVRELDEERSSLRIKKSKIEDLLRETHILLRKLNVDSIKTALQQIKSDIEKYNKIYNNKFDKITNLNSMIEALRAEADRLMRMASLLGGGETKCPLCGSELTPGRASELKDHLKREAEERLVKAQQLVREVEKERRKLEEIEERLNTLKNLATKLENIVEKARELNVDPDMLEEELRLTKSRIDLLERQIVGFNEKIKELSRVRGSLDTLWHDLKSKGIENPSAQVAETIRGELSKIDETLSLLKAREKELISQLESIAGTSDMDSVERLASRMKERLKDYEDAIRECQRFANNIHVYTNLIKGILTKMDNIKKEIEALASVDEEYNELDRRLRELESEINRLRQRLADIKGRIEEKKRLLEKASTELEELRKALRKLEILNYLRMKVFSDAATKLFSTKLYMLLNEASEILQTFDIEYVALEATYTPGSEGKRGSIKFYAMSRTGERVDVRSVSGGEKTALALSFVLALNRMLAGRVGFMILDEPTANLDEERRRMLVDIFRRLGQRHVLDQLIIVTHDEEVEDAADQVCRVEREPTQPSRISEECQRLPDVGIGGV